MLENIESYAFTGMKNAYMSVAKCSINDSIHWTRIEGVPKDSIPSDNPKEYKLQLQVVCQGRNLMHVDNVRHGSHSRSLTGVIIMIEPFGRCHLSNKRTLRHPRSPPSSRVATVTKLSLPVRKYVSICIYICLAFRYKSLLSICQQLDSFALEYPNIFNVRRR